jgi:menaquinone-specific isochorismate synthase
MNPALSSIDITDPSRIRREIIERLRSRLVASESDPPIILRAEVMVDRLNAMQWLSVQSAGSRGYWSDRDGDFQLAGLGRADMIAGETGHGIGKALDRVHQRLEFCDADIRYFGGMRFAPSSHCDAEWQTFKGYRFILPRFEVVSREGVTTFACNMRSDDDLDVVEKELECVSLDYNAETILIPELNRRLDRPGKTDWTSAVNGTLQGIKDGRFKKIVLARNSTLTFDAPVNAAQVLNVLKSETINAFHFCFQPDRDHAFIGASPERLYRRDGRRLRTEAIAGTRRRGATLDEDERLAQELLHSDKDRREHQIVVDGIEASLHPFVEDLAADEVPSVLKLAHNLHLVTRFRGMLKTGIHDGQVLTALHPTAAVGGSPSHAALQEIEALEPFDRGYYAAPVGWVERDSAQFVVGIRSALVEKDRVHLFAGAGIVEGSSPDEEWDEIEGKIASFLDLFRCS